MKIDMKKVKASRQKYYNRIVSLTKEDYIFVKDNKLSMSAIVREAIGYLRKHKRGGER